MSFIVLCGSYEEIQKINKGSFAKIGLVKTKKNKQMLNFNQ